MVLPLAPAGLSKRATQTSPKDLRDPAGSSELSAPKKTRPWRSQAITGSPAEAVRAFDRAAYGDWSPGYPGTSELAKSCLRFRSDSNLTTLDRRERMGLGRASQHTCRSNHWNSRR